MKISPNNQQNLLGTDRRQVLTAILGVAITHSLSRTAIGQETVSPNATPRDWSGQNPTRYPDPDIIALDDRFRQYIVGNTPISATIYGNTVGGRPGLEWSRALFDLE